MSKDLFEVSLTDEALSPAPLPASPEWGSDLVFSGVVRGMEDSRPISGIQYSCYQPMAEKTLREIAVDGHERFPRHRLQITHRTGFVRAGETSLFLRVSSPHSREGLEMCQWYLEQIKTRVPIWKEPEFEIQPPLTSTKDSTQDL